MPAQQVETTSGATAVEMFDARLPWAADETIIFHHGLGACGAVWRGWMPALASGYRLATFDMRGHGGTSVPEGYAWSMTALVDDLAAIADALVPSRRFHLVGESIGGSAALAYAARHPDRLMSLTVSNGTHIGGAIENLAPWRDIISSGGMPAWSDHMMGQRFHDDALSTAQRGWYQAQQAAVDADAVLAAAEALAGADLTSELAAITIPTLLLHPDDSPFIPVPVMADLHARLPNARLNVLAGARHGLPFSHAKACSGMVREFLDGLDRRGLGAA